VLGDQYGRILSAGQIKVEHAGEFFRVRYMEIMPNDLNPNIGALEGARTQVMQLSGNQLQLSWPPDHLGWRLQMQTNGLGTNWVTVAYSTNMLATNLLLNPAYGGVFLRLVYP